VAGLDPKSKFAGVASPMFTAAGNAFTAAVNGEEDPAVAVDQMKEEELVDPLTV
jgi:multiple sugar transport system substrate-binding protein